MVKNLCKGRKTRKPNKCVKVKGCKVASGKKRTFCRKSKNKTRKSVSKKKTKRKARLPEWARLKNYTAKQYRELRKLTGGSNTAPQPFVGTPYGSNLEDLPGVRGAHDGNYYPLNRYEVQPEMNPINERISDQAYRYRGGKRTRKAYRKKAHGKGKFKLRKQKGGVTNLFQTIGYDLQSAYNQLNGNPVSPDPLPYKDQVYFGVRSEDNINYLKPKITGE